MKRAACLLLMPAVLLTQWGGLGHCHGENTPAGHGLRPHVHTGLTSPAHGHRHSHHGHHHGSGGHHHGEEEAAPDATSDPTPAPPHDHDSDAIDLAAVDAAVVRTHNDNLAPETWVAAGPELTPGGWCDLAGRAAFHSRPPPLS